MNISDEVVKTLVAGSFGLIPVVVQASSAWGSRTRRVTLVAQLRQELELLERWLAVAQAVGEVDQERTRLALRRIMVEYNRADRRQYSGPGRQSLLVRSFLLFKPRTKLGAFYQMLFYLVMGFALIILLVNAIDPVGRQDYGAMVLGMVFLLGPVLLVLQRLALGNFKRAAKRRGGVPVAAEAVPD